MCVLVEFHQNGDLFVFKTINNKVYVLAECERLFYQSVTDMVSGPGNHFLLTSTCYLLLQCVPSAALLHLPIFDC